jgi:hypothetical protein
MAIEDANLIEGLFPRDFDEGIDEVLDIVEEVETDFDTYLHPDKETKQSYKKRKYDETHGTMRRRQPSRPTVKSYNQMKSTVKKLNCCVDSELLSKELSINGLSLVSGTTDSTSILATISQGDSTDNRTGKSIHIQSIELNYQKPVSSTYPGNELPIEIFLVRPLANGTAPVAADFSVDKPGSLYKKDSGWQITKLIPGTSTQLYKRVNLRNMKVTFSGGTPRYNNMYVVIRNYTPETVVMNGTIRLNYRG